MKKYLKKNKLNLNKLWKKKIIKIKKIQERLFFLSVIIVKINFFRLKLGSFFFAIFRRKISLIFLGIPSSSPQNYLRLTLSILLWQFIFI